MGTYWNLYRRRRLGDTPKSDDRKEEAPINFGVEPAFFSSKVTDGLFAFVLKSVRDSALW